VDFHLWCSFVCVCVCVCEEVSWNIWHWRSNTWRKRWRVWELAAPTWRSSVSSTDTCTSAWRTGAQTHTKHAQLHKLHTHQRASCALTSVICLLFTLLGAFKPVSGRYYSAYYLLTSQSEGSLNMSSFVLPKRFYPYYLLWAGYRFLHNLFPTDRLFFRRIVVIFTSACFLLSCCL